MDLSREAPGIFSLGQGAMLQGRGPDASPVVLEQLVGQPDRNLKAFMTSWIPFSWGGSYRYFTGSLAYVLHRVSGLALLFYIFFHIHSVTEASQADPTSYDLMVRRFQEPDFKIGEVFLLAALLFHGLNGLRILLVDFVITGTHWHKKMFWGLSVLVIALFIAGSIPLIMHWNVQPLVAVGPLPGGH